MSTEPAASSDHRATAMQVMAWDPLTYDEFAKSVRDGGHPDDLEALQAVDEIASALAEAEFRGYRQATRRIVGELRDFTDDLYATTGARWIGDALTSVLDRISEGDEP